MVMNVLTILIGLTVLIILQYIQKSLHYTSETNVMSIILGETKSHRYKQQ